MGRKSKRSQAQSNRRNKNKASLVEIDSVPKIDTADVLLEINTPTDYAVVDNTVAISNTDVFRKDAPCSAGDNITFIVSDGSEETRGNGSSCFEQLKTKKTRSCNEKINLEINRKTVVVCDNDLKSTTVNKAKLNKKRTQVISDDHNKYKVNDLKSVTPQNEEFSCRIKSVDKQSGISNVMCSVSASYHQYNENRYNQLTNGTQCTSNSLMFLVHHKQNENLQSSDLDKILDDGNALHESIILDLKQRGIFESSHLCADELPVTVLTDTAVYDVTQYQRIEDRATEIGIGLEEWFQSGHKDALLICNAYSIAVFKNNDGTFGTFDAHARNCQGLVDSNGFAVMMYIPTLDMLKCQVSKLFGQLFGQQVRWYTIAPLEISCDRQSTSVCNSTTTSDVNDRSEKRSSYEQVRIKRSDGCKTNLGVETNNESIVRKKKQTKRNYAQVISYDNMEISDRNVLIKVPISLADDYMVPLNVNDISAQSKADEPHCYEQLTTKKTRWCNERFNLGFNNDNYSESRVIKKEGIKRKRTEVVSDQYMKIANNDVVIDLASFTNTNEYIAQNVDDLKLQFIKPRNKTTTAKNVIDLVNGNNTPDIGMYPTWASYHQADLRFPEDTNGSQCSIMSLLFLAYHQENRYLRSQNLDKILDNGDVLYRNVLADLKRRGVFKSRYLLCDELPENLHTETALYSVVKHKTIDRKIGEIHTALDKCFSSGYSNALLFACGYTMAIYQHADGSYGTFDSHSRNHQGFVDPNGCAIMLYIPTLEMLKFQMSELIGQLGGQKHEWFQILPVDFCSDMSNNSILPDTMKTTTTTLVSQKLSGAQEMNSLRNDRSLKEAVLHQEPMLRKKAMQKRRYALDTEYRTKVKQQNKRAYHDKPGYRAKKIQELKNAYINDPKIASKQKKRINSAYRNDAAFKDKQKRRITSAYQNDEAFRTNQKRTITNAYRNDEAFKSKQKTRITTAYRDDEAFKEKQKRRITTAYRNDEAFKEKQKRRITTAYRNDEAFKEKQKRRITTAYRNDEAFKEKQKRRITTAYRNDEAFKEKQKRRITTAYRNDEAFRAKQKHIFNRAYQNDPIFKAKQNVRQRIRYHNNPIFRSHAKQRFSNKYKTDDHFRLQHMMRCASHLKQKYKMDSSFRHQQKIKNYKWKQERKTQQETISNVTVTFRELVKEGPTYVCTSCHRVLFKKQVKVCCPKKYRCISVANQCLTKQYVHQCSTDCVENCPRNQEYICHCCDTAIHKGKMPSISIANKLSLTPIPTELQNLNVLERHVIAKYIPFAKIVNLPKGKQKGIHGPVISVPSQVSQTVELLPRPIDESQLLRVKLKRRLNYKGYYQYQTLNVNKVLVALQKLKEMHSEYKDVVIDHTVNNHNSTIIVDSNEVTNKGSDLNYASDVENDFTAVATTGNINSAPSNDDINSNNQALVDEISHVDDGNNSDEEQEQTDTIHGICLDSCLQPSDIGQEVLTYDDNVLCIAPAEGNKPTNLYKVSKVESMAFPVQFPDGTNTFDEEREVKLPPSRYFHTRLFNVDNRFAKDANYLFFAQFTNEIYQAKASISIQLRKSKPHGKDGRKFNSSMLRNKQQMHEMIKKNEVTRFMEPLRGTPAYWEKTMRDLFAMLRQIGTPTFFCTFSAAEMRWPEVITAIKLQQGTSVQFNDLDWMMKCDILNSNPVTAMRMFDQRVDTFIKKVILANANPIGKVIDFFYRVEFQQRGSPHIHCLFWVKDAPEFDKDTDEEICDFVDEYISCELPHNERDPELHTIVAEVQSHSKNHSKSCKKGNKECRYGFPKAPVRNTFISRPSPTEDDSDEMERERKDAKLKLQEIWDLLKGKDTTFENITDLLNATHTTYDEYIKAIRICSKSCQIVMRRNTQDVWVNGYNKNLLRIWNANIDIQYILNPYCCIMYIVSYITKGEHELSALLKEAFNNPEENQGTHLEEMKKAMYVYSQNREVSAQEAVTRTCGLKMKSSSRQVVFVPTADDNVRMSLPTSVLETRDDDSQDVWMTNKQDRYKSRPDTDDFETMCMAEFFSQCRVVYGKPGKSAVQLKNGMGFVQKKTRGKPAIIRYCRFSKEKDPEKYYATLLKLYLPYRDDKQLHTNSFPTYESFYHGASVKLKHSEQVQKVTDIVSENQKRFEMFQHTIDDALTAYNEHGPVEDAWSNIAPSTEVERIEAIMEKEPVDPNEIRERPDMPDFMSDQNTVASMPMIEVQPLSHAAIRKMYQSLNEKQASEFYFIRDWCKQLVCGKEPKPFYHFLTGGAGTGKSHVIKCIYTEATKQLLNLPELQEECDISRQTVLLTAFTGTAAFNINGNTIHSIFKIRPRSDSSLGRDLDNVRCQLGVLQILVIDEISMISKKLFATIDARLRQIKGLRNKPFGGVSILAVGDFYQLPPILAKPLCIPESTSLLNLWDEHFEVMELTDIMRQKDDVEFAKLLNRIREKPKTEKLSDCDRNMLLSVTKQPADCPQDILHIFSRNKDVDAHNTQTLNARCSNIMTIDAHDYKKNPTSGKMTKLDKPMKGNSNDMKDMIQVAPGARVMLTRNIDVSDGLVNGSFGTVTGYTQTPKERIFIRFDSSESGSKQKKTFVSGQVDTYIERCEDRLDKHKHMLRRQFPIKLAYACTIHKVQGMTTEAAVVSLDNMFDSGMAYVALSRTTSLKGLHIINFKESEIYCNTRITESMIKMRKLQLNTNRPLLLAQTALSQQSTLTLIHHNTESLTAHIDDVRNNQELMCATILCLTETHLRGDNVPENLHIPGYKLVSKNRHACYSTRTDLKKQHGGGIAMYLTENLKSKVITHIYNVTDLECLVLKIEEPFQGAFANIYRPPKYSIPEFLQNLKKLMEALFIMTDNIIICGDFNEDYLSATNKPIASFFEDHRFVQLIDMPTTAKHTLLDTIYIPATMARCVQAKGVIQTYYSYHDAIFCSLELNNF